MSETDQNAKRINVLLIGPHPVRNRDLLASKLDSGFVLDTWVTEDGNAALAERLASADAAISMQWTPAFPPAPNLRLLQLPGAGFDRIDFNALPGQCAVCNVYEHESGIAEYVLTVMLEHCTDIGEIDAAFRLGDWSRSTTVSGRSHGELRDKTIGLVGYGHIGQAIARRALPFDTRVIAVTRSPRKETDGLDWIGTMERLPDLLRESDFVVLACALSPETANLIDAEALAQMKSSAFLINVARGAVVDEDALFLALKSRAIAGAAIDVWYRYPTPDNPKIQPSRHPFQKLSNVVMTPHQSGNTDQLWNRRFTTIADNLLRFRDGRELRNEIESIGFG